MLRYFRKRGLDASALALKIGLPKNAEHLDEVELTPVDHETLLAEASRLLNDPLLAVRLPRELEFPRYNVGELAAHAAPTLGEAFARVVKYAPLFYAHLAFQCEVVGRELIISQRLRTGNPGTRFGNEYGLATMLFHARAMSGEELAPLRVFFSHPPVPLEEIHELARHFGTHDIAFGRSSNGIAFAAAEANRPSRGNDPRLLATAETFAERALAAHPPERDFVGAVEAKLRDALLRGPVDAQAIARRLRLGQRTLQRRLDEHGTTFSDLLDRVRRDVSLEGVEDGSVPLAEVAARAGFSDVASFGRAFKRWTGQSPGEHRKARPLAR